MYYRPEAPSWGGGWGPEDPVLNHLHCATGTCETCLALCTN